MYVVFFGVGVGFVLLSFFADTMLDFDGFGAFFLQPKLIAVFLTVTGGVGIILTSRYEGALAAGLILLFSVLGGLFVAGLIYRCVILPLKKRENTSAFRKEDTIGKTAKVVSTIPKGGFGKIRYSVSGSVVTGPARSEDDSDVRTGENVFILDIDKGTYIVRRDLDIHALLNR